jgi:hypothetical protein
MLHQSVGRCGFPRTAIISARIDSATSPTGVVTALAYPFAKSSANDRYLRTPAIQSGAKRLAMLGHGERN